MLKVIIWVLGFLLVYIPLCFLYDKMYKLLKSKHPAKFKELGEPGIWKFQNIKANTAILFGKTGITGDTELERYISLTKFYLILGLVFLVILIIYIVYF